jgi:hypothetical protein
LFSPDTKSTNVDVAVDTEIEHQSKADKPNQVFTLFPKLPPELRNKIWNEHCTQSEPRIIDLWGTKNSTMEKMRYGTHSKAPPILHTSNESRYIGLKYYKLLFEGEIQGEGVEGVGNPKKPHIYVNWEHDILFPVPFRPPPYVVPELKRHENLTLTDPH